MGSVAQMVRWPGFPLYLDLVPSRLLSWDVSGQVAACPDTAVLSPVSPRMEPSWKAWDQDRLSRFCRKLDALLNVC